MSGVSGRGLDDRHSEPVSALASARSTEGKIARLVKIGKIEEIKYDPPRVRVRVGGNVTNWVYWLSLRNGDDGTWDPPSVGEQVVLLSPNGDYNQGVAFGGLPSDSSPAVSTDGNLRVRVYKDGSFEEHDTENRTHRFVFPEDGTLTLQVGDSSLTIVNGKITIKAAVIETDGQTFLNKGTRPVVFAGSTDSGGDVNSQGASDVFV